MLTGLICEVCAREAIKSYYRNCTIITIISSHELISFHYSTLNTVMCCSATLAALFQQRQTENYACMMKSICGVLSESEADYSKKHYVQGIVHRICKGRI